ncbi:hypothetical protein F7Q99_31715 [Streptomyces kaniharaensis]|uniref:Uncharacterized protein n=1 Tax=Streptomyces kaniharaensis TaxID=212423 RepID=A0A6N7L422_9ACTN|nr:hypothetical protein [Streptomyces kaniharaensis]MQS16633.1 hypothetical protein [Streptomyces kaniharaensis]
MACLQEAHGYRTYRKDGTCYLCRARRKAEAAHREGQERLRAARTAHAERGRPARPAREEEDLGPL